MRCACWRRRFCRWRAFGLWCLVEPGRTVPAAAFVALVCKCSHGVLRGQKEDRREEEAKREAPPRRRSRTPSALALHGFEVRAPYRRGSSWPRIKRRACGTTDSHVVPHRSTEVACSGLTSQIGRDTVRFTEYGRRQVSGRNKIETRTAGSRAKSRRAKML